MIRFAHPFGAVLRTFFALRARPACAGVTVSYRLRCA